MSDNNSTYQLRSKRKVSPFLLENFKFDKESKAVLQDNDVMTPQFLDSQDFRTPITSTLASISASSVFGIDDSDEDFEDVSQEEEKTPTKKQKKKPTPKKKAVTRTSLKASAAPTLDSPSAKLDQKTDQQKQVRTALLNQQRSIKTFEKTTDAENRNQYKIPEHYPFVWLFDAFEGRGADKRGCYGIYVNDRYIFAGNFEGLIYALDRNTYELKQIVKLPSCVKAIVADYGFIYAGCSNGNVYDLSNRDQPKIAYESKNTVGKRNEVDWMDLNDGLLIVSREDTSCTAHNVEGDHNWKVESDGVTKDGWMVRCDGENVYQSKNDKVYAYKFSDGSMQWVKPVGGSVMFGVYSKDLESVLVATTNKTVVKISRDGKESKVYPTDASTWACEAATVVQDNEEKQFVFAGDSNGSIYCFDAKTSARLWKITTKFLGIFSMQYYDNHLYVTTSDGCVVQIDISKEAVEKFKTHQKQVNTCKIQYAFERDAETPITVPIESVSSTTDASAGVILECLKDEKGELRVRVASDGYHKDWNVQFPKNIREEGLKFVVDTVVESVSKTHYRSFGTIKRLVQSNTTDQ